MGYFILARFIEVVTIIDINYYRTEIPIVQTFGIQIITRRRATISTNFLQIGGLDPN